MPTSNIDVTKAVWRKSSRSTAEGPNCVEVAALGPTIAVRDSKNPAGPALLFSRTHWLTFTNNLAGAPSA